MTPSRHPNETLDFIVRVLVALAVVAVFIVAMHF